MNQPSESEREQLLQRVVVGDLAIDAPEVRAAGAADPGFLRAIEELRAVQAELTAAAQLERAVLDEALGAPARRSPTRRLRRWSFAIALAAALVAMVSLLWRGDALPDATHLGSGLQIEAIERVDGGLLRLRWSGGLKAGDYYAVTLRNPDGGATIARTDGRLVDREWTLPALPDALSTLLVELEVLDATGRRIAVSREPRAVPR